MIIYKTTNLINCKIYVGKDVKNRSTYFGSGKYLLRAIKKYGKHNFKKETIDTAKSHIELCKKEIYWIKKLKSTNPEIGYNICKGGIGTFGYKMSNKTKNKIGRSKIGNTNCIGRIISDETRKKMSDKKKGKSSHRKGKKLSKITKLRISKSQKLRYQLLHK